MIRTLSAAVIMFTLLAGSNPGVAWAKQCRDTHGKFVKCPTAMTVPAPARCRDAKGKFKKCSTMKK